MINLHVVKIISKKEIEYLLKEKTFFLLLFVFIMMASLSTFIGWSTQHTITSAYDVAAQILASAGQTIPASPLQHLSSLGIIKNMIIYVVLIGSLLSIILGYFIGINDRISNTVKLIFSRQVKKKEYLFGKILAGVYALSTISIISFVIGIISAGIFHVLSITNALHMIAFYGVSFFYMLGFMLIALAFSIHMKSSANAILYSLFIWIVITFALPELGSALYPTSSLNPVLPPTTVLDSSLLTHIHSFVYPFSVSEHFKSISTWLLGIDIAPTATGTVQVPVYSNWLHLVTLLFWNVIAYVLAFVSFIKIKAANSDLYE